MVDLPAGRQACSDKMYFVYVILSLKTKEFYKGLTNNVDLRIKQHFEGKTTFSRNRLPLTLIHVETCSTRTEARKVEKFLKSGYGREIIKEIADKQCQSAEIGRQASFRS